MRGTVLYGPRDVRFEEREDPKIVEPTDAIIRTAAVCVCGSELWSYRGIETFPGPQPMGHEYVGVVEEVGGAVGNIKPGQFVVGSFFASDNTRPICQAGHQGRCVQAVPIGALGAQAPFLRVPLADGTLVATPELPPDDLIPSLLAASDVLGTGWFAADAAAAGPGKTVVVVGDGAVGLLGVLSAKQMGAERIIVMSRHESRQKLAREYGATDIVTERGDEGAARIKDMTDGLGAHSVIEAVGTQESMMQAIRSTRPGGHVGFVGVTHGVEIPGLELFFAEVHLHGGPAPVRRYLPDLIDLIWNGKINPGKVFDLRLPLGQVAEGVSCDGRAPRDLDAAHRLSPDEAAYATSPLPQRPYGHSSEKERTSRSWVVLIQIHCPTRGNDIMKISFENQVALVTGAASGIGLATAKAFAEAGAAVVSADVNGEGARAAADELVAAGHKAIGIRCNVADLGEVEATVKETVSTFGRLDVAFNNAGIQNALAETADTTPEDFDRVNSVNLRGIWACMKYELQHMRQQGSGAIVNCSSIGGLVGGAERGTYHASKHGVLGLTKSAALEYATRGIRVNAVCPGLIWTPMAEQMAASGQKEALDAMVEGIPMRRHGRADEIADAVLWLCSSAASYVTGQSISVDGGLIMR